MCHCVGFFCKVDKRAGDTAGYVEETQIADFACGVAKTSGHLTADCKNNFGVIVYIGVEISITNLGDFALITCSTPSAAIFGLFE